MSIITKDLYDAPVIVEKDQLYYLMKKKSISPVDSARYIRILDIDKNKNTITYISGTPFFYQEEFDEVIADIKEDEEDNINNYIIIDQSDESEEDKDNIVKFLFDLKLVEKGDLQKLLQDEYWQLETDPRIPKCSSGDFFTNFINFPHKFYVFGRDQWNYILINKRPPYLSEQYELNMDDIICLDDNLEGEWLKNNASNITNFETLKLEEGSKDLLNVYHRKLLPAGQKFYTTGLDSCLLVVIYDNDSGKKIVWHTTTSEGNSKQTWYYEHPELKTIKSTIDTLGWNKDNVIVHFTRNKHHAAGEITRQNNVVSWVLEFMDIPRINVKLFNSNTGAAGYDLCPMDPKNFNDANRTFGTFTDEVEEFS